MTYTQANILAQQIRATHSYLRPEVRTLGNGDIIIRFEQTQYRKTVGFFHIWEPAHWSMYLESLNHKSKRKEVAS